MDTTRLTLPVQRAILAVMDSSPTDRVAEEIRATMARRRVSQLALATAIGLSQQALSRRLTGVIPFDVNELSAIAFHLDVHLHSLLPEAIEERAS